MKVKIVAPHQQVGGREIQPGEEVDVPNRTIARQLIASGYAVEAGPGRPTGAALYEHIGGRDQKAAK